MINQSKKNDLRFNKIWRKSGATGDINETDRRETIREFRKIHYLNREPLSRPELSQFIDWNFVNGPETIKDQVMYYYLRCKLDSPSLASDMQKGVRLILSENDYSASDVRELSSILYKYVSGSVIRHDGKIYSKGECISS